MTQWNDPCPPKDSPSEGSSCPLAHLGNVVILLACGESIQSVTNFDLFNRVVDEEGRAVTFYTDPDRLERHLNELSPEDAPLARTFCADIRRLAKNPMYPFLKPWPLMSMRERFKMILGVLPDARLYARNAGLQMNAFCGKFKSPLLRRSFPNIFFQDPEVFPLLPYMYNLACAHNKNAGIPQGGSLGLAKSVEKRYRDLGGEISYRAKVTRVLVDGDRAVGIELADGSRHYADAVVSACDGATTIYKLLEGKYVDQKIDKLYKEVMLQPQQIYPGGMSVFLGIDGQFGEGEAHSTTYLLNPKDADALPAAVQRSLVVQHRSRYSNGIASAGKSVLHCTFFADFDYWKKLRKENREQYRAEKRKVVHFIQDFRERRYPGLREKTEVVQVASPATTERYTGNYNGSILAWRSFSQAEDLANSFTNEYGMKLPGLKNFYMAGQWVSGGGLIRAASSGRFAVQFLCRDQKRPFQAWLAAESPSWGTEGLQHLPILDEDPAQEAQS